MKRSLTALALALLCVEPQAGSAAIVFFDNFDQNTTGLNVTPASWTVTNGTVDIIGAPAFFDLLPGNGRYVDLDGSSDNSGVMTSSAFAVTAGQTYELTFSLAGSQRGDSNTVTYGIDLNSDGVLEHSAIQTLASSAGFNPFALSFIASTPTARIVFDHAGSDNVGLLLDNVQVTGPSPVPLPTSLLLFASGLASLAAWRRKQA